MERQALALLLLPLLVLLSGCEREVATIKEAQAHTLPIIAPAPKMSPLTYCRLGILRSYIGTTEATGNNDGAQVGRFLASTKLGEGYAWCGSCQHCAYRDCDTILKPEAFFARAAHWYSVPELVVWKGWPNEPVGIRPGDHGGIWYERLGRVGHTFCIDSISRDDPWQVWTLEGNTNAEGSRDGNTFARRKRSLKGVYRVSRW